MRVRIGTRLGLGFLVMLLLVAAAGLTSIIAFGRLADLTSTLAGESDEVRRITDIRVGVARADTALESAMATLDEDDAATALLRQSELQDEVASYLESKGTGGSEAEALEALQLAQQYLDQTFEVYLDAAARSGDFDPRVFAQRQNLVVDPYLEVLNEIESQATARMVGALEAIQRTESTLLLTMIAFTIVAAVVGAVLAVRITRSVTVPVAQLVKAADQVSVGDLDVSMEVPSRDEIGELADSMERMRVSLKAAMERLTRQR